MELEYAYDDDAAGATKTTFRRMKQSGTVRKQVRENYLRRDVHCMHAGCLICPPALRDGAWLAIAEADGDAPPTVTVPSLAFLRDYLDLLETQTIRDVVVPQTAWRELQHCSGGGALHRRLKRMVEDLRNRIVVFPNENFAETWSERRPGESWDRWCERLIYHSAVWYSAHLGQGQGNSTAMPMVVYIRPDLASDFGPGLDESGLVSVDARDFVSVFHPELADLHTSLVLSRAEDAKTEAEADEDEDELDSLLTDRFGGMELSIGGKSRSVKTKSKASTSASVTLHARHWSLEDVGIGLKAGRLVLGVLQVSKYNRNEGYVRAIPLDQLDDSGLDFGLSSNSASASASEVDAESESAATIADTIAAVNANSKTEASDDIDEGVVIQNQKHVHLFSIADPEVGRDNFNRAMHGDRVAITKPVDSEGNDSGTVVAVLGRSGRPYVCTLEAGSDCVVVPMDVRIPKIRVKTADPSSLVGMRVVVRVDRWDADSRYPTGHLVRRLGPAGDHDTETEALMIEHGMDTHPRYESTLLRSLAHLLPKPDWQAPAPSSDIRDFRDRAVFSIDPKGSMDIDDAMHVRRVTSGGDQSRSRSLIEVGVHIAHVSRFVTPGSLLDVEARARATTLYLVDRRRNMIPEVLSENVCSLLEGVDRLAVSTVWTIDRRTGAILDTWFGESLIHNRHALYYRQAQDLLDMYRNRNDLGASAPVSAPASAPTLDLTPELAADEELKADVAVLADLAGKWKAARVERGALELEGAELQFDLASYGEGRATGDPQIHAVRTHEDLEVNAMVAELMIGANVSVAAFIQSRFPRSCLLRTHGAPPDTEPSLVNGLVASVGRGLRIEAGTNADLQTSLDRVEKSIGGVGSGVVMLVKTLTTMSMSEARYINGGSTDRHNHAHFGLAVPVYTHFTSPIRRYADIVVHRMLLAGLKMDRDRDQDRDQDRDREEQQNQRRKHKPGVGGIDIDTEGIAAHVNEQHRQAKVLQRESQSLFLALYLKGHPVTVDDAIVYKIHPLGRSLYVFVPRFRSRGVVRLLDSDVPAAVVYGSGVESLRIESVEVDADCVSAVIRGGTGAGGGVNVRLLDRVSVELGASESPYRTPSVAMKLVGVGGLGVASLLSEPGPGPEPQLHLPSGRSKPQPQPRPRPKVETMYDCFSDYAILGEAQTQLTLNEQTHVTL